MRETAFMKVFPLETNTQVQSSAKDQPGMHVPKTNRKRHEPACTFCICSSKQKTGVYLYHDHDSVCCSPELMYLIPLESTAAAFSFNSLVHRPFSSSSCLSLLCTSCSTSLPATPASTSCSSCKGWGAPGCPGASSVRCPAEGFCKPESPPWEVVLDSTLAPTGC